MYQWGYAPQPAVNKRPRTCQFPAILSKVSVSFWVFLESDEIVTHIRLTPHSVGLIGFPERVTKGRRLDLVLLLFSISPLLPEHNYSFSGHELDRRRASSDPTILSELAELHAATVTYPHNASARGQVPQS
jgi:hypothetical protein